MLEKRIITVALTGAMSPKANNPEVPVTPEEIAEDAYKCYQAGAAIVHLHMRDEYDQPSNDLNKFEETIYLIKRKCNIICQPTSTGKLFEDYDVRLNYISKLNPEMCSYDPGSLNWMSGNPPYIMAFPPSYLSKLNKILLDQNIKPEIEIFDTGMIGIAEHYAEHGELKPPFHFQFVLGVKGGMAATVENLVILKNKLPEGSTWSAFGISKWNLPIMYATIALGGNVRVGLEDCSFYSKEVRASNEMLVSRAARVIREFNCEPATPDEARQILSINK
ncbi:MAG TPA: 3-keto-5-aminohexanoate cleavage protein [Anaerovoracaceae bacterium]|nr:3-keto-5-aminohexanoate cleavage protein [Anaerovoracaceae bacterium]